MMVKEMVIVLRRVFGLGLGGVLGLGLGGVKSELKLDAKVRKMERERGGNCECRAWRCPMKTRGDSCGRGEN